ncbi:cytochrome b [Mangrovibrevibacter kandeliae]|uniref:cytochrome b n=1 Tax=Mangrovibrevibacter kandeliae TaxID=2968473 RepID=UPI002117C26E|nr:cytochrome b/b6 domain-containing protein [Aurantimonas sp. CSK15Z-1]MCQ8783977.1 cytochrome b/b6 domain-containing protein [Aurantimonas sp. CSK15Z-1]
MERVSPRRTGWSRLNIWMHWLIVALILVQYIDHESMVAMWRSFRRGTELSSTDQTLGWVHIIAGTLVLVFAAIRLWDRFARGRPPYPENEPSWAYWLAKVTHGLIYALLFVIPVTGLVAWFGNVPPAGEVHEFLWNPLLVLIALHILGALAQQFWFKTDVLRRIVRPG